MRKIKSSRSLFKCCTFFIIHLCLSLSLSFYVFIYSDFPGNSRNSPHAFPRYNSIKTIIPERQYSNSLNKETDRDSEREMANSNYFDFDTMHIFVLVFISRFSSSLDAIPICTCVVRCVHFPTPVYRCCPYTAIVVIAAVVFIVNDLCREIKQADDTHTHTHLFLLHFHALIIISVGVVSVLVA